MRRKLLITYLTLTTVLLLALEIPLVLTFAMNEFHHLAIPRLNDTARFATLAAPVLRGEQPAEALREQITRFDRDNDTAVLVVNRSGQVVLASRPGIIVDGDGRQDALRRALDGKRADGLDYPYNLRAKPLFLAEPVQSGEQVLGAVVTVSPTNAVRDRTIAGAAVLGVVGLLALAAAAAAAVPFTRWILRPIHALDTTARSISGGRYEDRASMEGGPPEVRGLAMAFNTMADRLVTTLETQRAFVADASHQMRNPLTALRLRMETLDPHVTETGKAHLATTVAEAERLGRILDELLRLARADTAQPQAEDIDVLEVAEQRATAWGEKAAASDVVITVVGPRLQARCAPGMVDQVLDVLIDNALHVSPAGGSVTVRLAGTDSQVRLHVIDQGPGMSEEDRAQASARFWRGADSRTRDGTGLGLSIATALLKANGGELHLDAASPHGLDAVVTLPAVTRSEPAAHGDEPVTISVNAE